MTGVDKDLATLREFLEAHHGERGACRMPHPCSCSSLPALDRVDAELSRLREERDAALRIAPFVRQVIAKALRRDMTQPPVTREELQVALDLLPEPPSFRSSVDGMAALVAAEARCARLQQAIWHVVRDSPGTPESVKQYLMREALAATEGADTGPDTPADSQEDKT